LEVVLDNFQSDIQPDFDVDGEKPESIKHFLVDVIETVLLSLILFAGINAISARIRVDGSSMLPTLQTGEFVIVNKLAYKIGSPSIGDIIVFRPPRNPTEEYIKRVIGLPGDRVEIRDGKVYINSVRLQEPYLAEPPAYQANWFVPDGSLFVLGDNRNNSSDSHSWGPVPISDVIGKAVFIYWPPSNWGLIEHTGVANAAP
jgi:signal peptidase I